MSATRTKQPLRCSECGWTTVKWVGRCGECQAWGTVAEAGQRQVRTAPVLPDRPAVPIGTVDAAAARATATGVGEFDRVLGGGLVPGAVVLVAGEPGIGKSTLALDVAARVARGGRPVLYVSGEESAAQVRLRAERTRAMAETLYLAAETDLAAVLGQLEQVRPALLVVDSVQTVASAEVDGAPGNVSQVREVAAALIQAAKRSDTAALLIGHVTKDGAIAGPRVLEHLVDVVVQFEGERHSRLRLVRAVKNRFGPTDEVGCFDLGDAGIVGLSDPSGLFLTSRDRAVPGTCVTVTLEGRRPLVTEVQALVTESAAGNPRRATSGLDASRLAMVLAVLTRRAAISMGNQDCYASTVGGVRLSEPAADLALALAVAGARLDRALPQGSIAVGEVGLAGDLRAVTGLPRRLAEAARIGFTRAVVPAGSLTEGPAPAGMTVRQAATLAEAVGLALEPRLNEVPDALEPATQISLRQRVSAGDPDGAHRRSTPGGGPGHLLPVGGSSRGAVPGRGVGRRPVAERVDEDLLRATLAAVAPGTELRDGLERVLRGRTGALIVMGYDRVVESLCSGGFELDVDFSATRLRELAKMDGAVVLDREGTRIVRAATQLVPDPTIETRESGTRHRTAERVAKQTGHPVVSVSQSMAMIAVYVGDLRHVLEDSSQILSRAHQALQTLERYKSRLDEVAGTLSALEIEDLVTIRDITAVLQRLEMVRRISTEVEEYALELGTDGRLINLQLEELTGGLGNDRELVIRDYIDSSREPRPVQDVLACLSSLSASELLDLGAVARCLGFVVVGDALEGSVSPRGYRLLSRIPRLPGVVVDRLIEHFGTLQHLLSATVDELMHVEGVGDSRARAVREGLSRLAESSILERYV